jgi:ribose transport system ATP-binding protein
VLRDGAKVLTTEAAGQTKASLVSAMMGSAVDVSYPALPELDANKIEPLLSVKGLKTETGVGGVDFDIRPGEIVGLIGLVGSGRSEIARAIAGVDPIAEGSVSFDGQSITGLGQRAIIRKGMVLVPEDRRRQGLVMSGSIRHNMSLPHLARYSNAGVLRSGAELSRIGELMAALKVVPPRPNQKVVTLSGGNQQKVLIAKWLMERPRLVILDEPTKGVDVGARRMIYDVIMELASKGTAILIISSEIEEVLGLAHRAFLMTNGRFIDEITCAQANPDAILRKLFDTTDTQQAN